MTLRDQHLHDPYLVGNGTWCSTCFPDGPPAGHAGSGADDWQSLARPGCNECQGYGRVAFSAETIVRLTRAGGTEPDPPTIPPRSPRPARRVERVRPQTRRRTA